MILSTDVPTVGIAFILYLVSQIVDLCGDNTQFSEYVFNALSYSKPIEVFAEETISNFSFIVL